MLHGMRHPNGGFYLGKSQKIVDNVFAVLATDAGYLYQPERDSKSEETLVADPSDPSNKIMAEISKFLESKEKYHKYGVSFKRGVVMYGPPGTGKTATVKMLRKLFVEKANGLVITNAGELHLQGVIGQIRDFEPDRPIMLVFDDIRRIQQHQIEFMDGQADADNIIFLFTTNYFSDLPAALKRPSRTDLHVEITGMTDSAAAGYMSAKFFDNDFKTVKDAFNSNGIAVTYALLKEVMILRHVFDTEPAAALIRIKTSGCDFQAVPVVENKKTSPVSLLGNAGYSEDAADASLAVREGEDEYDEDIDA